MDADDPIDEAGAVLVSRMMQDRAPADDVAIMVVVASETAGSRIYTTISKRDWSLPFDELSTRILKPMIVTAKQTVKAD